MVTLVPLSPKELSLISKGLKLQAFIEEVDVDALAHLTEKIGTEARVIKKDKLILKGKK